MEKKGPTQELEKVSNLFISSSEKEKTSAEKLSEFEEIYSGQAADEFEIEETVSVRKRIAYPDTENAQENIRKCLFKHLEEGYFICRVELRKNADILKPRSKKKTKEEILIFLKESPSY